MILLRFFAAGIFSSALGRRAVVCRPFENNQLLIFKKVDNFTALDLS
jgi:hypothetical protein